MDNQGRAIMTCVVPNPISPDRGNTVQDVAVWLDRPAGSPLASGWGGGPVEVLVVMVFSRAGEEGRKRRRESLS